VVGLAVQVVVLAGLAATVGLSGAGWLTGLGYGIVVPHAQPWPAPVGPVPAGTGEPVTLAQATLVGGVVALAVTSVERPGAGGGAGLARNRGAPARRGGRAGRPAYRP
jgi:hypothetical protein